MQISSSVIHTRLRISPDIWTFLIWHIIVLKIRLKLIFLHLHTVTRQINENRETKRIEANQIAK